MKLWGWGQNQEPNGESITMYQPEVAPKRAQKSQESFCVEMEKSGIQNGIINLNNTMDISLDVCYGDHVELADGRLGTVRYIGMEFHCLNKVVNTMEHKIQ